MGHSDETQHHDSPPERAGRLGHVVQWDPPFGIASVERWTCTACGSAVLRHGGNVYGSAVEGRCGADIGRTDPNAD